MFFKKKKGLVMEQDKKKPENTQTPVNSEFDDTKDDNSKNKGSSEVDIGRRDSSRNYGRTTDTLGVGHEPGTTPGRGF